jgi:DNA primase
LSVIEHSKEIKTKSEKFATVISGCRSLLNGSSLAIQARAYVRTRMTKKSQEQFGIGFFPDAKNINELTSLVGDQILEELNLIKSKTINNRSHIDNYKRGFFDNNNIIFPFKDEYGNIIALAGRTLLDKEEQRELAVPKYKNTVFGKSLHLYGMYETKGAIEKHKCAIIVEGQIDCISCHASGFNNTVALTSSELTLYQLYALKKRTDKIYLLLDNDKAGRRATKKAISKYSKFIQIETLELPDEYNDVDDYLRNSAQHDIFNVCYQSGSK